jgi:hypothetical protein
MQVSGAQVVSGAKVFSPVGVLWSGASSDWTAALSPLPANAVTGYGAWELHSLTCSVGGECLAFGSFSDASFNAHGLIVNRAGPSWTAREMPPLAGTQQFSQIAAATCLAASSCIAVGTYDSIGDGLQGLLLVAQPPIR